MLAVQHTKRSITKQLSAEVTIETDEGVLIAKPTFTLRHPISFRDIIPFLKPRSQNYREMFVTRHGLWYDDHKSPMGVLVELSIIVDYTVRRLCVTKADITDIKVTSISDGLFKSERKVLGLNFKVL